VTVTSDSTHSFVGLAGDFTAADGTVIGQGVGNVANVVPGETYRTTVIYSLTGKGTGGECGVVVDSVM
jgi:hypothetical protein